MKPLAPIWRLWQSLYYARALREINPLHDDLPGIVIKLAELETA